MAGSKYVFFDLGGTLLDISCCHLGVVKTWKDLGIRARVNAAELTRRWIATGQELQANKEIKGEHAIFNLSLDAMKLALADLGLPSDPSTALRFTQSAWAAIRERAVPFPDANASVFQRLTDRGFRLGIITDADEDLFKVVLPRVPRFDLFDPIVGSWEVGVTKPHPRIFQQALEASASSSANCAFVGDAPTDVPGARALGMLTVIVDRQGNYPAVPAPDLIVRSLAELPGVLDRIHSGR